jgi:UDP-2-acetamido-3-amino-2,3-dideoxy-glucuronate N-acetyltransferase
VSGPADIAALRLAVVGTGHWGRNLVRNFAELGVLKAICDANPEALESVRRPGVDAHPRIEDLLADTAIDAVAIATPAETHGALAARVLAAGKHVFVEKPIALDLAEAVALGVEADRRGLILMVGHLLLYHPAYRSLKGLVERAELGELRYIYSNRLSLGRFRREENALWSFAPHDVSMILDLSGRMPTTAMTSGGTYLSPPVADTTLSHLTFAGGLQAHIFVSWLHPYNEHRLVVVGSKAMASFQDSAADADKLLLYRHTVGWQGDIPSVDRAEAELVPYDDDEPLALECRHFVQCVTSGRRPRSDADEATRVLTVLDACQRSLHAGLPMALDNSAVKAAV